MSVFLSSYTNKVDAKGRVSVPAGFRAAVAGGEFAGVYCNTAVNPQCIEGYSQARLNELIEMIDRVDDFSEERYDLERAILSETHPLGFDGDGRIVLNEALREHARITDQAMFVGLGRRFQIWEPSAFEAGREAFRDAARRNQSLLRGRPAREAGS